MVDLSKLKAGDTVYFRCGGSAVVESICPAPMPNTLHKIRFVGYKDTHFFGEDEDGNGLLQVIRVESAFRWEDVKPGMGFRFGNDTDVVIYIGPSLISPKKTGVFWDRTLGKYCTINHSNLTPAPEHDIEVTK